MLQRLRVPAWFSERRPVHLELVSTAHDLPLTLRGPALAALPPGVTPWRIVSVPEHYQSKGRFGWRHLPECALLFTEEGLILVRAADGSDTPASTAAIAAHALLYLRSSLLLLYGRLEFGLATGGVFAAPALEYNTVGWRLLEPGLRRLLCETRQTSLDDSPTRTQPGEHHAAAILENLPYKFASGLRHYGLQPGEILVDAVFQPAIWTDSSLLFRRQTTPGTLLALTDQRVIVVEDEKAILNRRSDVVVGWHFTHIPRHAIAGMRMTPQKWGTQLSLCLEHAGARTERSLIMDEARAKAWCDVWEAT